MEENILEQIPDFKLHKKGTITICTFLAGPLVAGYLIAENFNQLNERRNAIKTWIYTIAGFVVLFGSFIFIPALERIPNFVFAIIYTSIATFFVRRYQEARINLHQERGGQFFSVWRAVLASVISLVLTIGVIFLIFFIVTPEVLPE
jgi:hypothetical protein